MKELEDYKPKEKLKGKSCKNNNLLDVEQKSISFYKNPSINRQINFKNKNYIYILVPVKVKSNRQ